jgi:hypothetical protein
MDNPVLPVGLLMHHHGGHLAYDEVELQQHLQVVDQMVVVQQQEQNQYNIEEPPNET